MIVIDHQAHRVSLSVFGEFTLADYKEFEEIVNFKVKFEGPEMISSVLLLSPTASGLLGVRGCRRPSSMRMSRCLIAPMPPRPGSTKRHELHNVG
jgi:hypothetical protein